MILEQIAVAAILLTAVIYLGRFLVVKHRPRPAENACNGCGCGKAIEITSRKSPPMMADE
jgi:hypothetical protein